MINLPWYKIVCTITAAIAANDTAYEKAKTAVIRTSPTNHYTYSQVRRDDNLFVN